MISTGARHFAAAISIAALALGGAACSGDGEGTETDCSVTSCTVTFDRGADAEASILGVKAKLVDVKSNQATLKVGGQKVTVPVDGESNAEGFKVGVQKITDDEVVVKISQGIGG